MEPQEVRGISRRGLDAAFEADETRKSRLIMEARLLRDQLQDEAASAKFALAAAIEEQLSERCEAEGLLEKSYVHRFSAASCWAQAGNFYRAIDLCRELLAREEIPARLRQRVQEYSDALRARRAQWYAETLAAGAAVEG
jgi:hypothetical protein